MVAFLQYNVDYACACVRMCTRVSLWIMKLWFWSSFNAMFVLATGIPIDKVASLNQETRNYVGRKLLEITLMELFVFRFMQAGPRFYLTNFLRTCFWSSWWSVLSPSMQISLHLFGSFHIDLVVTFTCVALFLCRLILTGVISCMMRLQTPSISLTLEQLEIILKDLLMTT